MNGDDDWSGESWREAARDYHAARKGRPVVVELEAERVKRLRELMGDNVSIERAWDEINRAGRERYNAAPPALVEALMFSLRERGIAALKEPATQRRLAELSDDQIIEIEKRLQALKLGRGAWSEADVEALVLLREELRND